MIVYTNFTQKEFQDMQVITDNTIYSIIKKH